MFNLIENTVRWLNDIPGLRWLVATFITVIHFLDDEPYYVIVVWIAAMLADLFTRLWRLSYESGGLLSAIKLGKIRSAKLIQGVADEFYQLAVWCIIAWAATIPIPDTAAFTIGSHLVVVDNLVRSLPFAYLAVGDIVSIAENFIGAEKDKKKQQFYLWLLETLVMTAEALRARFIAFIGGGHYSLEDYKQKKEEAANQPPIISELDDQNPYKEPPVN